jgi:hypothetical protein
LVVEHWRNFSNSLMAALSPPWGYSSSLLYKVDKIYLLSFLLILTEVVSVVVVVLFGIWG